MNILPHKSWNVYNEKNRTKVAEDEAQFEVEVEKKKEEQINNDRLYRLQLLRNRAHGVSEPLSVNQKTDNDVEIQNSEEEEYVIPQSSQHINLFLDEEKDKKVKQTKLITNIDKQREYAKKDKNNLFVKDNMPVPWYAKSSNQYHTSKPDKQSHRPPIISSATLNDPLTLIKKYTNSSHSEDSHQVEKSKKKRKHKSSKRDKEHQSEKSHKSHKSSKRDKEYRSEKSHKSSRHYNS